MANLQPHKQSASPAELAQPAAFELIKSDLVEVPGVEVNRELLEEFTISRLEVAAGRRSMLLGRFFVKAARGISLPVRFNRDENIQIQDYIKDGGVCFEGTFCTYGMVETPETDRTTEMRALCLAFIDVFTVFPCVGKLPEDKMMHTPVFAVDSMQRTA